MKGTVLALVLALNGGCALYFGGPDDDPDDFGGGRPQHDSADHVDAGAAPTADCANPLPEPSSTCAADFAFDLAMNWASATVPVTLDTQGTTFCIRLDSSARTHPAYFEAHTATETGWPASFGIALYDADGQLIEEGYDAPLNGMHTQTYATVTLEVTENEIQYVKVHAWARQGTQATNLHLSFYQIID